MRPSSHKLAIAALIVLAALAYLGRGAIGQESSVAESALSAGLFYPAIPGALNLAVTQTNIQQTICVRGWTATVRPPTSYTEPMKKRLMAQAGIPSTQTRSFELDHHLPLEAGGNPSSPDNLALQSYVAQPWNAHLKDKLENFAHRQICSGRMSLQAAQAMFLNADWRLAYCRYFKSTACTTLPR